PPRMCGGQVGSRADVRAEGTRPRQELKTNASTTRSALRQGQTQRVRAPHKEIHMAVVTTRQLLESGVHFGHQTRRWNPKMKRFIFTERNGIYIIDLQQSLTYIDSAYAFVKSTVARGGQVLFIGT